MFETKRPIPFFFKGPDPKRFYARDIKRWTISSGDVDGKKSDFKVRVVANSQWGWRETIGSVAVPVVGFLLFGAMCLSIWYYDPQNENVGMFLVAIVGISGLQLLFFTAIIWVEVSYFRQIPAEVLTVFDNGEFCINGEKARRSLTPGSVLRYAIHHPEPGGHGGESHSELDLLIRDGDKETAVHKLMAYQDNWCWQPSKKVAKLSGIPLQRISVHANGERFTSSSKLTGVS